VNFSYELIDLLRGTWEASCPVHVTISLVRNGGNERRYIRIAQVAPDARA